MARGALLLAALVGALGSTAAAPSDPVLEAAIPYVAFRADIAAMGAGKPDDPAALARALTNASRTSDAALSRGWIAYGALVASQSPAFAAGVQSVTKRYGRAAVVRALTVDAAYPSRRAGYAEAIAIILAADRADSASLSTSAAQWEAAIDTVPQWPKSDSAEARASALRALSEAPPAPRGDDRDAASALKPPAPDKTLHAAPARAALLRRMTSLAALRLLNADSAYRGAMDRMLTDAPSRACIHAERLQFFQCVSVTQTDGEAASCLARHGMRGVGACMSGLTRTP